MLVVKIHNSLLTNTLLDDDGESVSLAASTESWFVVALFNEWIRDEIRESRKQGEWQPNSLYVKICKDESFMDHDEVEDLLAGVEGWGKLRTCTSSMFTDHPNRHQFLG